MKKKKKNHEKFCKHLIKMNDKRAKLIKHQEKSRKIFENRPELGKKSLKNHHKLGANLIRMNEKRKKIIKNRG